MRPTVKRFNASLFLTLALVLALGAATASQAAIITYTTLMSGAAESPPNASPGTGSAIVDYDNVAHTLRVRVNFSGLTGNVTASHIHAPTATAGTGTAGIAVGLTGFPTGVTSGNYDHTFDLTSNATYSAAFLTNNGGTAAGAEAGLVQAMNDGKAYPNVHSLTFPGGEIRGFLQLGGPTPANSSTWGRIKSLYR